MSKQEMNIMLKILPEMIDHYEKTENKSLLVKIYGVFTIKTNVFETIHILLMQNGLQLHQKN